MEYTEKKKETYKKGIGYLQAKKGSFLFLNLKKDLSFRMKQRD